MDKKAQYELTAPRMTLCPVCFEEIAVRRLEKHLLKEHSRAKPICCISCSAPFKKSRYVQHIRNEHSDGFWIGTGVKKAQLGMVIQRWYSPVPDKNTLYTCSACHSEIESNQLFQHQKTVHGIDYLNPKVIATMQPGRLGKGNEDYNTAKELKNAATVKFTVRGVVPLRVCQELIINSAYWYTHQSGKPVRAPKHHNRVTYSPFTGGRISFGANTFLIQKAAEKLIELLEIRTDDNGRLLVDDAVFAKEATEIVASSVKSKNGRYAQYPIQDDGHMRFGAQSIHVPSFIKTFTEEFRIRNRIPL